LSKREYPILFCFCSPSGGGKSTICRELIKREKSLRLSISTTTRAPRRGEVDGADYYFVDESEFKRRVTAGLFVEHARYGGGSYGTELRNFTEAAGAEADLLLDIDVQGARALQRSHAAASVTICVFPPSVEKLKERLSARGTETEERIAERLKIARQEIVTLSEPGFSNYLLINDDLGEAVRTASSIISAERQRFSRFDAKFLAAMFGG
jgi:guanylate kinase